MNPLLSRNGSTSSSRDAITIDKAHICKYVLGIHTLNRVAYILPIGIPEYIKRNSE